MIASLPEVLVALGKASSAEPDEVGLITMLHPMVESEIQSLLRFNVEYATYTEYLPSRRQCPPRDPFVDAPGSAWDIVGGMAVWNPMEFVTGDRLQLTETPVRSIVSVFEDRGGYNGSKDGSFGPGTQLTEGQHFYLDCPVDGFSKTGQLVRISGAWPALERSVKVTYTAGYQRTEIDKHGSITALPVKAAVLLAMQSSFNANQTMQGGASGAISSETTQHEQYQYDTDDSGLKVVIPQRARQYLQRYVNWAKMLEL